MIDTSPLVGNRIPVSILIVVDLPAPLGPIKASISPFSIVKLTLLTAFFSLYFGLNIDFGIFQQTEHQIKIPGMDGPRFSLPEELAAIAPYVAVCHAKFNHMNEKFEEETIPYPELVKVLQDNDWEGYLISEYEGANKDVPGYVSQQLKRHQIMLKRLLGY